MTATYYSSYLTIWLTFKSLVIDLLSSMSLIVLIWNTIIANEICRVCNVFMVTTPRMDCFFTNCTYMFSIYRDALHWTNRANMIHINGCNHFFWFLSKVELKNIITVNCICCICQAALANPRIQCICSTHSEISTRQMPPGAASVTANTVLFCRVAYFVLF